LEPPQTATDEPSAPARGPRSELLALVRSLRGQLEELEASGAWGLPAAPMHAPSAGAAVVPSPPDALPVAPGKAQPPSMPRHQGSPGVEAAPPAGEAGSKRLVHLPQASVDRLRELAEQARACTSCGLHEGRGHSVFARGSGSSGIVFVGEGPGEEEDRQGLPFVGPAGQLLDRMIAAMQLGRDDVYVCNIVKCRPPKNRKPEPDEMARCMPFLAEQLSLIQPRVIIALGATAVQGLLGTTEGITRLRGSWKLWRGTVPVMPTFHPAYLLRTPQAKRDVWKDLQEVLRRLNADAAAPE
jgi:DNA polymerase